MNLETSSTHAAFPGTYICIPGDESVVDQVVDVRLEARHLEAHQLQPRLQAHVIRSTHCGFSNRFLFGAFFRIKNKQFIEWVLISISHRLKLPLIFHLIFFAAKLGYLEVNKSFEEVRSAIKNFEYIAVFYGLTILLINHGLYEQVEFTHLFA